MAALPSAMPASFWAQNKGALTDSLDLIYAEVVARLRDENPEADTLELMLIERVAFLYCYIRNKEGKALAGFAHDRAYKETLQLWTGMAADLRKAREKEKTVEVARAQVVKQVQDAIAAALVKMPKDVRMVVGTTLADAFEGAL